MKLSLLGKWWVEGTLFVSVPAPVFAVEMALPHFVWFNECGIASVADGP